MLLGDEPRDGAEIGPIAPADLHIHAKLLPDFANPKPPFVALDRRVHGRECSLITIRCLCVPATLCGTTYREAIAELQDPVGNRHACLTSELPGVPRVVGIVGIVVEVSIVLECGGHGLSF